jgi:proteasomal ATPase-associated factor 1
MSTATNPIFLSITTVQHDFQAVATDVREGTVPSEDFWISCYHQNEPSIHGKVRTELDQNDRHLVLFKGRDGVQIERPGGDQVRFGPNLRPATYSQSPPFPPAKHSYLVSCPRLGITKSRVVVPNRTYPSPKTNPDPRIVRPHSFGYKSPLIHIVKQPTKITAFDLSPDGSQIATGYEDGTVILESTSVPTKKFQNVVPKVHVAYVSSLRFFPSSRVLLTAGADFALQILPAEQVEAADPVFPVRILRGHTRVVTDTAIVSKGRNVISSAKVSWVYPTQPPAT